MEQPIAAAATPDLTTLLLVLFLTGVIASGITEILKTWLHGRTSAKASRPLLWKGIFRLIPIILGTLIGTQFLVYPWGIATGAAGGTLSVVVYKKAKALITNLKGV